MQQPLPQKQKIFWQDNSFYFLTTSTFLHYPYFKVPEQKQIVLNKFKQIKEILKVPFQSHSIAINHFHIMFYLKSGKTMAQLKNMLHSGISREYKKFYQIKCKNFWQTTKIFFIKDEKMYWQIIGYINGNLLKHREVSRFEDLKENPFSSYKYYAEKYGDETMQGLIRNVINLDEDNEGTLDLKQLKSLKTKNLPQTTQPLAWPR
ncbi:MAG: hypothetical protein WC663_03165 [Patescibacteria group bacterium]